MQVPEADFDVMTLSSLQHKLEEMTSQLKRCGCNTILRNSEAHKIRDPKKSFIAVHGCTPGVSSMHVSDKLKGLETGPGAAGRRKC